MVNRMWRGLWWIAAGTLGCRETLPVPGSVEWRQDAPQIWEARLAEVVTEDGLVDYDALEADHDALDGYLVWLSSDQAWPGRVTRDRHAQYLNAYNALVLYQVLERGRPDSVLDVQGWMPVSGYRFFHGTQFQVGRDRLTLSEIENERIRWKEMDYRDHSAMNCGSMSCPPLRAELYRPRQLRRQLEDQMQRWLSDPERGVRIEGGQAVFSPLFEWFERDFQFFSGGKDPCTLAAAHVEDRRLRKQLNDLAAQGCPRTYFEWDWSLNDAGRG